METKVLNADIVITGAGPAGIVLAALLGQSGLDIVLIDAEAANPLQNPAPSGRTAALLTGSINVLKAAGVWEGLSASATPLKTMRIVDDSFKGADQVGIAFDAREAGLDCFGYNIPNNLLKAALTKRLETIAAVTHLRAAKLKDYTAHGTHVTARLEDGRSVRAAVIVGTDGRNSAVRAIAGIAARKHDYNQTAMTCLIEHTKPHNFTSTEFHRAGGPFTFVPMPGNTSSVVWVEKTEDARKFLSMKREEYRQAIQDRSLGLLGTVKLLSAPESWPLMLLSVDALIAPRAALAAEAAHVLSPIGAQGLNLSLRDVATLAETIVDAVRLGEDIGAQTVLSRYARRRAGDIRSRVLGIDGLNRVVANDLSFLKDLRRLGLKSLDKIPHLKQLVTHHGLTPPMDEGRLLSGAAL